MLTAIIFTLFSAVFLVLIFVAAAECFRVWSNGRSRFHTARSLLIHFVLNRVVHLLGAKARWQLERDSYNFAQVQEAFLLNILKKNSDTKYGKKFKFKFVQNRWDFVRTHPITNYSHYKNFVGKFWEVLNIQEYSTIKFFKSICYWL